MHGFTYTLRLLEPVLANSLAGDANSAQSLRFIPGALVRGAVIAAYLEQHKSLDATDSDTRRLFFDGGTRYLHAYPYGDDSNPRALPVPLAWRKRKKDVPQGDTKRLEIFDLAQAPWPESDEQAVALEGFCFLTEDGAQSVGSARQINVHTQRDAQAGRATTAHGAVYRYEALAAGTRLAGVVLTKNEEDAATIRGFLEKRTLSLGKARTAGYGRVQVESVEELSWWEEAATVTNEDDELSVFTLTLLSETLVRDADGQNTLDILPALQQRLAQLKVTTKLTARSIFRRGEIVGGFNRTWGLPTPQVMAAAAGSVFVVEANPPVKCEILEKVRAEGLGERHAEGFGRFALNWQPAGAQFSWSETKDATLPPDLPAALHGIDADSAEMFLRRLLRNDLERALQEAVLQLEINRKVSNSQLSRWRGIIRSASRQPPEEGVARLTSFRDSEERKNSTGWKEMHRARVNFQRDAADSHKRLTDWMTEVFQDANSPWKWLCVADKKTAPQRALAQIVSAPDEALRYEFQLRLVDGVLARAAKQK